MTRWVLATRSGAELAPLREALASRGVGVLAYPVLREEPATVSLSDLGGAVGRCAFVAFTSGRAPAALRRSAGRVWPEVVRLPAAAVGSATAEAAGREGFRVEVVGESGGAALGELLGRRLAAGAAVLHACGREHRDELARSLSVGGVVVVPIVVYDMAETAPEALPPLPAEEPELVLLTSPRAARAYLRASGRRFAAVPHVALGATTAAAAAEEGVVARALSRTSAEAVVEELCRTCS